MKSPDMMIRDYEKTTSRFHTRISTYFQPLFACLGIQHLNLASSPLKDVCLFLEFAQSQKCRLVTLIYDQGIDIWQYIQTASVISNVRIDKIQILRPSELRTPTTDPAQSQVLLVVSTDELEQSMQFLLPLSEAQLFVGRAVTDEEIVTHYLI